MRDMTIKMNLAMKRKTSTPSKTVFGAILRGKLPLSVMTILLVTFFVIALSGCGRTTPGSTASGDTPAGQSGTPSTTPGGAASSNTPQPAAPVTVEFSAKDLDASWDPSDATVVTLNTNSIAVKGEGATAAGSTVTISSGGTYVVSGTLSDGQISVNAGEDDVKLVLNGAHVTNCTGPAVNVASADKVVVTLADGTSNVLADGVSYQLDSGADEPNAALYSRADLTINGSGSLKVSGAYKHGINCKDSLKIVGGAIVVDAAADGVRGRDCVAMNNGSLTVTSAEDGIQANNDEDPSRGFIYLAGGTVKVTAGGDGVQAETNVLVKNGQIEVSTAKRANGLDSWKGIKAQVGITIDDALINLETVDDSIHSNGDIVINGGTITVSSGDDGIHADASLVVNGGDITVQKSYEALESAKITINGGQFHVGASDDGINTSGGADGSSVNGRPGQNKFADTPDNSLLAINGGYVYVDAQGDGIDVNGDFSMSEGVVIVNGPVMNGNGALDCNGEFTIKGGLLVAVGSAGMAEAPDQSSTQNVLRLNLGGQPAGSLVRIAGTDGQDIVTFSPSKAYESVVVSSPALKKGSTYRVYAAGSCTGIATDGLYEGGTYTPGNVVADVTISGIVTEYGQAAGGGMGGGGAPEWKTAPPGAPGPKPR